jgi:2-hydroxyacyl-CoA lyase 1
MKRDHSPPDPTDNIASQIASLSPEKLALLKQKLKKDAVDGHTLVAQSLKRLGVTHVYSVAGTPIRETFAACAKVGIRPLGVRHQQAGVMTATAQNYVTGRLAAIAILSAGPGVTNAATSILVAQDNCWPLVVLGGRRPLSMRGMGSFQELDAVPIFQSITKWSALVEKTARIPEYLDRAFHTATSGRPGPVYLDLPEDVLAGTVSAPDSFRTDVYEPPVADTDAINQAADILLHATRPAIIIGKGLRWSEPYKELQQLVNSLGIPFITSPMGQGYLPDDHPLCCNAVRGFLQSKADAILLLGARLDWTFRFGTQLAPDAKLIQVDIHAQEIGVNVTPTVGIVGDTKQVLRQLLTRLDVKGSGYPREGLLDSWHAILDERRKERTHKLESQMDSDALPMSPHRMMKEIRDFLPRDAICVLDGNVIMAAAQQVLPSYVPASRLTAGSNGCMGVGIPFGIGAKLSYPERLVIVICGDTAFGFNAMDMETAVRHGVPLIVVVANNEGISGALTQEALFPPGHERVTVFQQAIHYENIMAAFGGHAECVEHPQQLKPALKRAVESGTAACINVRVDPYAAYPGEERYPDSL